MQLEIIILSKVSQTEKDKYRYNFTYTWDLKRGTNEPIYKAKADSQTRICLLKPGYH